VGFGAHLPSKSYISRSSIKQGHLHQPRRPPVYAWQKSSGASFQNLILSKFHICTTSNLGAQSSLSSLIKHWAVAQVDGIPLARTSIARILSKCFGDSPVCFKVCTFGPHIFTFLVANANVAAELLIRGEFKAEAVSFIIVPSFRKAFSIAPLTNSEEQTMKSNLNQSLSISQENSPFLLSSSQTAVTEGQTQSCQSPLESTPLAKRSSCAHLSGSSEEQNPPSQ
jgi:hypothetical protein